MVAPAVAAAGVSLLGGLFGARSAKSAANAQAAAAERTADKQIAFAEETRDLTRADLQPFIEGGMPAYNALAGIYSGPAPTAPWEYGDFNFNFEADPGYQFRLGQGLEAVQGSVAARHGLNSGATQKALLEYGQNFGSNEYNNAYNRAYGEYMDGFNRNLTGFNAYTGGLNFLAGSAQNAAAGQGSANALAGQTINQALGAEGRAVGNAQSAGIIGQSNALSQGINNALGAWQYNSLLNTMAA